MKFLNEKSTSGLDFEDRKFAEAFEAVQQLDNELACFLWNRRGISYSRFWEIALAGLKKGVQWTDVTGMDHSDGVEVKTATTVKNGGTFAQATIGKMTNKTGALKMVIYHHVYKEFMYYYVPKERVHENVNKSTKMSMTFPQAGKNTNSWHQQYRVATLKELASK